MHILLPLRILSVLYILIFMPLLIKLNYMLHQINFFPTKFKTLSIYVYLIIRVTEKAIFDIPILEI